MSDTPGQPMEDILASIRRIIAEDRPLASPPTADGAGDEDDVLELGDAAPLPVEPIAPPPPAATVAPPAPRVAPRPSGDGLISGETVAAGRRAMSALSGMTIDPQADPNTMDGLVREMLRPLLKEWLDANLPEFVERIVAREIARIGAR